MHRRAGSDTSGAGATVAVVANTVAVVAVTVAVVAVTAAVVGNRHNRAAGQRCWWAGGGIRLVVGADVPCEQYLQGC